MKPLQWIFVALLLSLTTDCLAQKRLIHMKEKTMIVDKRIIANLNAI